MSSNHELMEAVARYNQVEQEFQNIRTKVADLLREAAETQQVTQIARQTRINRTTIYWLIKTWSSSNGNNHPRNNGSKG